jgi:hypothetical protein
VLDHSTDADGGFEDEIPDVGVVQLAAYGYAPADWEMWTPVERRTLERELSA